MKIVRVWLLSFLSFSMAVSSFGADDTKLSANRNDNVTEKTKDPGNPVIVIETSLGTIKAELWPDKARETVENFLHYTDDHFYDGLIFHRVMKRFMIQGGGFTPDMKEKSTRSPIQNEARSDTRNDRGTLAMARTSIINSATSQFFINLIDNGFLNHRNDTPQGFGYCVFGQVIEGIEIVDKIGATKTGNHGRFSDVPVTTVTIKSIRRAE